MLVIVIGLTMVTFMGGGGQFLPTQKQFVLSCYGAVNNWKNPID